ncbi:SHM4 [Symbiodinium sp. CCMP2592]|nr:SHM4 [Symbiodinium sp. CCMP2592]
MFCAPVAVAPIWPSPAASSSRAFPIGKPRAIPPPRGVATALVGALAIARRTAHYGDRAGALIAVGVAVSARVLRRAADTDSASSQRLVENLQRQVARLEEANRQLQAEVLAAKASLGLPTEDAEQARSSFDETGRFAFPKADLPFPLESLRLVPPERGLEYREEEGDWISLFRNAAPYIAAFRGGTVVVHLPSFMLEDDMQETFRGLMEDVAFCSLLGLQMVLVTSIECRLWRRLRPDEAFLAKDGAGTKAPVPSRTVMCHCVSSWSRLIRLQS